MTYTLGIAGRFWSRIANSSTRRVLASQKHFADGNPLDPAKIEPEIIEVSPGSDEARLFRFATLLWSIPVSRGFGRRLRFLVRDRHNGCLIGLFALGDPVFNLNARDSWIGWSHQDRAARLVHVMDAYVLGAVPPYSFLIGGKMIAALMGSREVKDAYERKYLGKEGVISQKPNQARLVLLTTTSALGRSSLYNRLVVPGGVRFIRIGETKGFGHFHISGEIFGALRDLLGGGRSSIRQRQPIRNGAELEDSGNSCRASRHWSRRQWHS